VILAWDKSDALCDVEQVQNQLVQLSSSPIHALISRYSASDINVKSIKKPIATVKKWIFFQQMSFIAFIFIFAT